MATSFSWTCPYCNRAATITGENFSSNLSTFNDGNKDGALGIRWRATTCPNPQCREYELSAALHKVEYTGSGPAQKNPPLMQWQLRPRSNAKPFPSYVPLGIIADYEEACQIRDLSPKAAATLARRCLQGAIRDYWGIRRDRLIDEINDLKGRVDGSTWQAIDAVRSIGNIGAHMEKDIDVIVDVDPNEAQLLLGLIEILLKEWYVARHEREEHLQSIIALAGVKKAERKGQPT